MKKSTLLYLLPAFFAVVPVSYAHPGPAIHDFMGVVRHWATGADHILVIAGIGLALFVLKAILSRSDR